ncbi:Rv2175c family DNA-binding protein [Gordonia sp. CPCC 205515]|uniref:Rv2175c family DNA-binding protein n=1 Tax=Gordonia sp. CPCC 205515 TaxID=3140791 RepID=UPI003AF3407E
MGSVPLSAETLLPSDTETLTVDEVAARLRVSTNRVRTLIRDQHLLAVSRGGAPAVPAVFFDDLGIAKHFNGLVAVLFDGGYTRDEAMEWLFTEQDDLGMHPAAALHTHSAREVIRRAQAQAF